MGGQARGILPKTFLLATTAPKTSLWGDTLPQWELYNFVQCRHRRQPARIPLLRKGGRGARAPLRAFAHADYVVFHKELNMEFAAGTCAEYSLLWLPIPGLRAVPPSRPLGAGGVCPPPPSPPRADPPVGCQQPRLTPTGHTGKVTPGGGFSSLFSLTLYNSYVRPFPKIET